VLRAVAIRKIEGNLAHVQEKVRPALGTRSANVEKMPEEKDDFVSEADKNENEVEHPVARCCCDTTKYHE
jgi:hypothetical protein